MNKKILTILFAGAFASVGARASFMPTNYESFVECIAAAERGETNKIAWINLKVMEKFSPQQLAEIDERLSAIPDKRLICMYSTDCARMLPKSAKAFASTIKAEAPNLAELLEYKANIGDLKGCAYGKKLTALVEVVFLRGNRLMGFCDGYSKRAMDAATKTVRRQLRKEGLPIISTGGRDYAKERLDALANALNAPRMTGVKEALLRCGIEITKAPEFPFIETKDSPECKKLMDDIYNGVEDFKMFSPRLRYILGVDEYNAFVTRYNSGN